MMMLTRFFRKSLSPKPSCTYLVCENYRNNFSSIGNEDTEVTGFHKNSASVELTNRYSLNGDNSDSFLLNSITSKHSSKDTQNKITHDLSKKLKLLIKGSKGTRRQYIMDRSVAETVVMYLKRDLGSSDIIVESSPGLGLLTETILAETSNAVVAYEPNKKLRDNLEESLLSQNSDRLQIQSQDFEKFYGYYIIDQREPEKPILQNFLGPMLRKEGSEYSPVKIVGVIYDAKFINTLILSYTFQCCLYGVVSPVLYMYIPFTIHSKITKGNKHVYSSHGLQFQYYFDVETLHMVPKESFYPVFQKSRKRLYDDNSLCLVKISPREELFEEVPQRELEGFHYFISTVSRIKRGDSLIMGMERWIPDCGPELIKNGFHVFAHPRELTPDQLLQAYKIFIRLPSYPESTFHHQRQQFVARFGSKIETILVNKSAAEPVDLDDHEFLET